MTKKNIKLGDIIKTREGYLYIYAKCNFRIRYPNCKKILYCPQTGKYFGQGLDSFNNNLEYIYYNPNSRHDIIDCFRPCSKFKTINISESDIGNITTEKYRIMYMLSNSYSIKNSCIIDLSYLK